MAKASVDGFDLEAIRKLLTAGERKVFESSVGKEVARAGREQVLAAIGQTRALRDKWRDLLAQQARTTKRTVKAGTGANDRSREKADLFAAAVTRLEARLAEIGSAVKTATKPSAGKKAAPKAAAPAKVAAAKTAAPARGKPAPKKVRTAAHRKARAGVKRQLAKVAKK